MKMGLFGKKPPPTQSPPPKPEFGTVDIGIGPKKKSVRFFGDADRVL
jgi:hypothetical protein